MTKFYWNTSTNSSSKIHWMSWDRMACHKHRGGLGFKNLRDFNMAMLAKQCWRLITNPDSLVAKIYKAKYYADTTFIQAKLGGSPSFIWRSVMEARQVISAGSMWRIGTGKDIDILNQPWLNDMDNPYVTTNSPALINQKVMSLFQSNSTAWDLEIITDIFEERDQRSIVNTVVEQGLNSDVLSCRLEISGHFTVRSAYRMIQK